MVGSLQMQPFLLAPCRLGCLSKRDDCASVTEIHTDDVNQCLHYLSGSHGVPNADLFDFMFLLVEFSIFCH